MNFKRTIAGITMMVLLAGTGAGVMPIQQAQAAGMTSSGTVATEKAVAAVSAAGTKASGRSTTSLYDNEIGMGINYQKQIVTEGSVRKVLNIITCDLENKGADMVFSKAKDIERKMEVLTKQVKRETYKGNNVVAAINADMFDMGVGYSSGLQIRDNTILTNHNAKYEENVYPIFGVDMNRKAFIGYEHMDAAVSLATTTGAISFTPDGTFAAPNFMAIDSVNRENCKDKIVLVDYRLNQTKKLDITSYVTQNTSSILRISGVTGPLKLGTLYEGTVETLGVNAKTSDIPSDGVLLCATGAKAKWLNSNFKQGDRIRLQVNYDRNDIRDAVGAYTWFVQDGKVLTNAEMISGGAKADLVNARKARTAVGIAADNKVIAITVDGGTPSKGISDGITLYEMAKLLRSLGAMNAVAFDGGGSTQMNAKLYGESSVSILTKPSDGRERALTNGIMFLSNNERSYEINNVSIDSKGLNIYKGSAYKFKAKGMDTNFNRLDLTNAAINWTADSTIGKIDRNGNFTAAATAAIGKVTANVGMNPATANVTVYNDIPALRLTDTKTVAVQKGVMRQFAIDAKDAAGTPILVSASQIKWSVTGNMGTIDKNGLLTVTAKAGSGVVTATVGAKKASVTISIMPEYKLIDDFEHNDVSRYLVDGTIGAEGTISTENAKTGIYSYKLTYDYDKLWDRTGVGSVLMMPTFVDKGGNDTYSTYTTATRPKKLGVWVYGDGQAPMLGAQFTDSEGNPQSITLASAVNWSGWKYLTVDIPTSIKIPMTLEALFLQETNLTPHKKGSIFIDDIRLLFSDNEDNAGPLFTEFYPVSKIYAPDTVIRVKITDVSGVDKRSITAKLDGAAVQAAYDENTGVLSYQAKGLKTGSHSFEIKATDLKGNSVNPAYTGKFTYSTEADTVKPVINSLLPVHKSMIKATEPRISVKIKDDKSGVNASDINIQLDGTRLKAYYDEASGFASAAPSTALSAGEHKLSVSVADRAGNKAALSTISFTVIPIVQPGNPNEFSVSVLSDTHATEYGYKLFEDAGKNESELIIQNGDLVDKDSSAQWSEAMKQLTLLRGKQYMASPGNHEGASGSLSSFNKYFGLPVYGFTYGNSLFVSLNSAVGSSISASDPTQFDYLQQMLEQNKKANVFVYTHVPTRDSEGIKHALPAADVKKLEGILTAYKSKFKDKEINVIFGHMHAFQSWTVGGVNYAIDGNGCLKDYVSVDKGGYLGYTKFFVSGSKVTRKVIPMPEGISIMDPALVAGELKLIKGATRKLNVYGDFSYSSSDYIAQLNSVSDVNLSWEVQNPAVATVAEDGTITARSVGTTEIVAKLKDKTVRFNATVLEPLDAYTAGFRVALDSVEIGALTQGKGLKLRANGYDIYGNNFAIDNSQIVWSCSAGTLSAGSYTAPSVVTNDTTITITAAYKTYLASQSLIVKPGIAKEKKRYATVTSATLNIRSNPTTTASILGVLNKGDRVQVLGEENGWLMIGVNDRKGYISKAYTIIKEN